MKKNMAKDTNLKCNRAHRALQNLMYQFDVPFARKCDDESMEKATKIGIVAGMIYAKKLDANTVCKTLGITPKLTYDLMHGIFTSFSEIQLIQYMEKLGIDEIPLEIIKSYYKDRIDNLQKEYDKESLDQILQPIKEKSEEIGLEMRVFEKGNAARSDGN